MTEREANHFWKKVDLAKSNECWAWQGATYWDGYGKFYVGSHGRKERAHRLSYELFNGPIPDGIQVLHHCDNPPCVNPWHLFTGTHSDNMKDCASKGRQRLQRHPETMRGDRHWSHQKPHLVVRGERSGRSKIDWATVTAIRQEHIPWRVSYTKLAEKYGLSRCEIGRIVRNEAWIRQW